MLGLKKGTTEFCRHNSMWTSEAEKTIKRLRAIFKDHARDIQHIGSTAVRKIRAKPIIDIVVGVTRLSSAELLKGKLRADGFIFDSARSNERRLIFFKLLYSEREGAELRTHNIYVVPYNSKLWLDYIVFRDSLNANDYKAYEYEALKLTFNGKYKYALPSYIKAKAEFILRTIDDNFPTMLLGKPVDIKLNAESPAAYPKISDGIYPIIHGQAECLPNADIYIIGGYGLDYSKLFRGIIIAHIWDKSNDRRIYIAAREGEVFYKPEILEAVEFYNKTSINLDTSDSIEKIKIVCQYEKSCGAVLYAKDRSGSGNGGNGDIKFLLVRGPTNRVGFPKGHIERGETEFETALREIYEETSLNVVLKADFKEEYEYRINGFIKKKVVYFLAEFNINDEYKIRDNKEIIEQRLISYEEARSLLRFTQDKEILRKAYEKIKD